MVYLSARYYETTTARFISVDPIDQILDKYGYVSNNPIRYIDPLGLNPLNWTPPEGFKTDFWCCFGKYMPIG